MQNILMILFKQKWLPLVLLLPQLIIMILFFIYPVIKVAYQSLWYQDVFGIQHTFAGLNNYIDLFNNNLFLIALSVTLVMALCITIITMGLGLLMAYLVNDCSRHQAIYKNLLFWPYAVSPALAAILWRFFCHPNFGFLHSILMWFGIDFNYKTNPFHALIVVVMCASWQQVSYNFLFYFIALRAVPKTLLEVATLDGASAWRRFLDVTWPLISPTTFFLLTVNVTYACFDTFGIIDLITHGGPAKMTTSVMVQLYQDGFLNMDLGLASTESILLIAVMVFLTIIQFRFLEKKVHYQ